MEFHTVSENFIFLTHINAVVKFYYGDIFVGTFENSKRKEVTFTWSSGNAYIGRYKDNKRWNGKTIYKDRNENSKNVNGEIKNNDELLNLINAQSKGHFS